MFGLDDLKEWKADRGKHAPLRGNFLVGGMWLAGQKPLSMAATLDGNPQEDVRLMVSTGSTCHVFDFETFKRGKLHKEYPHMLNYVPYRDNIDNIVIRPYAGNASPMKVHGTAAVPIVIDDCLFQVFDVYLVDMGPELQGVFSGKFLADYGLQLGFGEGNAQHLIFPPENQQ
ncbi:hypothetical protein BGW39_008968 [Mortierella sp. 14UC]|nr:hypothetical protein BGW39_008968 [Mortierella sp. 14UC]